MANYALIYDDVIVNVILWDGEAELSLPEGYSTSLMSAMPNGASIGWLNTAGTWQAPSPVIVVPQTVAMWQAKAALQEANLLTAANTAITAMNNEVLTSFWANASTLDRSSPTLAALATAVNLTSDQVDQLFITAAALSL